MAAKNRGYRYLLVVVDVLSRMVFGIPVKSKSSLDMIKAFDKLFDDKTPILPQRLFTDQG
ncbi:MAG TPA: transposase family protein [Candidatus Nitrosocosmicus sp.]|nr:transposase family protein [Nitrososphaeraceae archaeon]HKO63645.1 transposase family protein [Candidatus Nitrosocosmicus sp.]